MNTTACKKDRSVIKNRSKLPRAKSYYATKNEHVSSLVRPAKKKPVMIEDSVVWISRDVIMGTTLKNWTLKDFQKVL